MCRTLSYLKPVSYNNRTIEKETIPKRDITIADNTKKTVVISLWNVLATDLGQKLLDMADESPIVAIKSLRVYDFQGVSLSTVNKSFIELNPNSLTPKN
ncbi:hypothetical protein L1987_48842 [Smallanthus sonchifolius]|uniref:Uncharacterized protein n=1 Tax=Smallanthus sonchifolius TaxID=185202 RepID=A0ACB9FSF0_9ASTR|nr:hypothetical protein L1987_48842 [Smallanthus sonchifolius]